MEYTPDDLAQMYNVEINVIHRAISENGFTPTEITEKNEYLIGMYIDYLKALAEANEIKDSFRFQDGEEMIDKSNLFQNHRRLYMDLFRAWKDAKTEYERATHQSQFGAFHLRQRAGFLDERRRKKNRKRIY